MASTKRAFELFNEYAFKINRRRHRLSIDYIKDHIFVTGYTPTRDYGIFLCLKEQPILFVEECSTCTEAYNYARQLAGYFELRNAKILVSEACQLILDVEYKSRTYGCK